MATQTRIRFLDEGFRAILQSPGTRSLVQSVANGIQAKAGPNFKTSVKMGEAYGGRWIAYVRAATRQGDIEEATAKRLTGAVG